MIAQLALSIVVFYYGGLSDGNLKIMAETMEKILATTKMSVTVIVCSSTSLSEPCNGAIQDLALRVLETAPTTVNPAVLGGAVTGGTMATLYLDHIREKLWKDSKLSMGVLAGVVASHEIGHLLLQSNGHAQRGLMHRGIFARNLYRRLETWSFSVQEIERIQAIRRTARPERSQQ